MYDDPKYIKNNATKVRLDTPTQKIFIATIQAKGMEKAVYAREAVERQLEIDNNSILQSRASEMGITEQQLVDLIINQYIQENSKPQPTKRGTENVTYKRTA